MQSLEIIEKKILEYIPTSSRMVNGIWSVDCLFNPSGNGRIFDYKFLIAQTIGQGVAYSLNREYSNAYLKSLIGTDFLQQSIEDIALKTCLLDSVYGAVFPAKKKNRHILQGSSIEKMQCRTRIIIDEAKRLLGSLKGKRVVNVGVVGDILRSFFEEGALVTGTDFDQDIVGTKYFNEVPILDGILTPSLIAESDLAIITGMTITSGTIDEILQIANHNKVKIIVFAETGANLASYYLDNGVHSYLSEYFPFYIFNGESIIDVCTV